MTATRLDITIEQGADYDGYFQLDFDPTGHSAAMQIRLFTVYPTALLTLTTAGGGLLIDGPNRRAYPVIPAAVAAAINAGRYLYDLKMVSPAGKTRRAYQGTAYVSAQVTDYEPPPPDAVTNLLTQASDGFLWQDGSGVSLPAAEPVLMAFQDGSLFAFQDGSGWLLPQGTGSEATTFAFQDGAGFIFQDGSEMALPSDNAGLLAAFQDNSLYGLQTGSTLQIA